MHNNSERKGAWLEVPAQLATRDSMEEWLVEGLGMPLKLLHKLKREQGIRQKTDRILLHLFPDEYDEYRADWMEIEVIYEDDFCLVVNKPAGLKVHPTHSGEEHTLANAIAAHYLHTGQSCKIRHIHRLDEQTSGAVLYAKNELAQLKLDEQMRLKTIQRQYIAFVQGTMKPSKGTIDEPIGRDRHHPSRRRVSRAGDSAITHYEVIEYLDQVTLLRLRLETGRTHQIRVHLSHLRHPILGDALYGGSRNRMDRQALHGDLLIFPHPFFQRNIEVHASWPTDLQNLLSELQF
jgi:23S rRNA pseudouridine1911/1915/1917 synthase